MNGEPAFGIDGANYPAQDPVHLTGPRVVEHEQSGVPFETIMRGLIRRLLAYRHRLCVCRRCRGHIALSQLTIGVLDRVFVSDDRDGVGSLNALTVRGRHQCRSRRVVIFDQLRDHRFDVRWNRCRGASDLVGA